MLFQHLKGRFAGLSGYFIIAFNGGIIEAAIIKGFGLTIV